MLHRIIAQRYRIEEHLGAGGMGDVWRATDLRSNETVALKRSFAGDPRQLSRELRIAAGLSHPNVVEALGTVTQDDEHWLVMEYLPSRSLAEILEHDGPIDADRAARIGRQIADVLAFLHTKNAVHRDVKPGNVLVTADDTAKLSDFGIARWAEVTRTGGSDVAGTPGYLAPEVAAGHEATSASDVFALGATLFAAVEGTSPWGSPDAGSSEQLRRAKAYDLTPVRRAGSFTAVLKQLMARDPAARPAPENVAGLLDGTWTPPRFRREPLLIGGATALVVALVATGLVLYPRTPATVGDPRTMDVCGLAKEDAFTRFNPLRAKNVEERGYYFNWCPTFLSFSPDDHGNGVVVEYRVNMFEKYGQEPRLGRLGPVRREGEKDNSCTNSIELPDGNFVEVGAKRLTDEARPVCEIADAAAASARAVLEQEGEIPRRDEERPANSLGRVKACDLLVKQDVVAALKSAASPYPAANIGSWGCDWDYSPRSIHLEFSREGRLGPDDGERVDVGDGREARAEPKTSGGWTDACMVEIEHRVVLPGPNPTIETVRLVLDEDGVADPSVLCAPAVALAKAVVSRLPKP